MSNTSNQVIVLREKFLLEVDTNSQLYDAEDVEKVRLNDFYVARFINFLNQGVDKGFEQMKDCFQWRKTVGVTRVNADDYSSGFIESGAIFPYLPDKEGTCVIHLRPKICNKLKKESADKFEKYCMQVTNAVDEKVQKEFGWGLVMNCSDLGVSDIDLNFIFQILPRLRRYFPNGCKYCIIYGLHWSVNYICKMALAAMPADSAKKIKFYGKEEELLNLIDRHNLPDYLNGTCGKLYNKVPSLLNLTDM